ncbi:polysaccharide deacetylase family protein [Nonomuraea sp. NPDC048916]|uniref:polysaccharide deacetylase family protein n=1 Tax=Nonomuraea sp. NPDC048916 TaxID=3154232 RepID=UPI00340D393C
MAVSAAGCGLASASPERDVLVPAEPTMIDFVDPAEVAGLTTGTLAENGDRHVYISYPQLKDTPRLNEALREEAARLLRTFRAATGPSAGATSGSSSPPRSARHELNVDWQLTAASSQVVGVRLRTGRHLGADWTNSTRTLWYDRESRTAVGSTGLLSGEAALGELTGLVKDELKDRGPTVDWSRLSVKGDAFDSMAFNRAGELVVEFDDCQLGPCSLGRLAVAVPAKKAEPLLSETGRRARDSARERGRRPVEPAEAVPPRRTEPAPAPDAASSMAGTVDCAKVKCVALTFADGPGPDTAKALDALREAGARATFFTVGSNAAADPGLLRRMRDEGHLVGNHGWSHRDLSKLPTSKISDSLARTADVLTTAIGQTPKLVRAPYGAVNADVLDVAREMGLALVGSDVDLLDRPGDSPEAIATRAVKGARNGAIILLRDTHRPTVEAIPDMLKRLRGKGYVFVTVPELYGPAGMVAGHLYPSGTDETRG